MIRAIALILCIVGHSGNVGGPVMLPTCCAASHFPVGCPILQVATREALPARGATNMLHVPAVLILCDSVRKALAAVLTASLFVTDRSRRIGQQPWRLPQRRSNRDSRLLEKLLAGFCRWAFSGNACQLLFNLRPPALNGQSRSSALPVMVPTSHNLLDSRSNFRRGGVANGV